MIMRRAVSKLPRSQKQYVAQAMPGFIAPQLCELVKTPPQGDAWVHEAKLDGYRMQLHVQSGRTIFFSRRGLDWTHRFPEIVGAAAALGDCILDGEVCAVDPAGLPSFAGLTDALTAKRTSALVYYVFDMMWGNGEDLTLLDLSPANARQLDLLVNDDSERRKCEVITNTMDFLNRKFGKRVVTLGEWTPPPGGYAGGKIAYNRIPSADDFW